MANLLHEKYVYFLKIHQYKYKIPSPYNYRFFNYLYLKNLTMDNLILNITLIN